MRCLRSSTPSRLPVQLCGVLSAHTSQAFNEAGGNDKGCHFADQTALVEQLKPLLDSNTTVLIKGSRSAHMEDVVAAITHEETT